MKANNIKFYVTLLLPSLLITGNIQAGNAAENATIIAAIQTNYEEKVVQKNPLTVPTQAAQKEALLQEVKIKSRFEAANAAYRQSALAVSLKNFDAAYTYIQEAVQLHPSNLDYLQPASQLAFAQSKYSEAEIYQTMALKIANTTLQASDHKIAIMLDNLAAIYIKQSRGEEAENLLRQSLALREQALGSMDPWVAISLDKIASLKMHLNEPDEVEELLTRSLHILQSASGKDHTNAAWAMHKLANFYRYQQNYEPAEKLYQQAIAIWQADSGDRRLDLAASLKGLGELYMSQELLDEAKTQFEQMQALLQQVLDKEHPAIDAAKVQLARVDAESNYRLLLRDLQSQASQQRAIQ